MRWAWNVLIVLMSVTLLVRIVVLDLGGSLLSAITLCLAVMMLSDGMREMSHYALVFAVLCCLLFFFDISVLFSEVTGRISKHTEPVRLTSPTGAREIAYKLTITSTPFFDIDLGFLYNLQSFAKIISPISMALAVYLGAKAHKASQCESSNAAASRRIIGEDASLIPNTDTERGGPGFIRFQGTVHYLGPPPQP